LLTYQKLFLFVKHVTNTIFINNKSKKSKAFNNKYGARHKQAQFFLDFLVTLPEKFSLFV